MTSAYGARRGDVVAGVCVDSTIRLIYSGGQHHVLVQFDQWTSDQKQHIRTSWVGGVAGAFAGLMASVLDRRTAVCTMWVCDSVAAGQVAVGGEQLRADKR